MCSILMAIFIVKVKLFQMVFFIKLLFPTNETKSVKKIDPDQRGYSLHLNPDCTLGSIMWTMFESFFWKVTWWKIPFEIIWPLICAVYWWQSNGGWRSRRHQKSYEQCIEKVSTTAIQARSKSYTFVLSKDLYQVQETWKFFFLTHIQSCVL